MDQKQLKLKRTCHFSHLPFSDTSVWIPFTRGVSSESRSFNITPQKIIPMEGFDIGIWNYKALLPLQKYKIEIVETISQMPPAPPTTEAFIKACLLENAPLVRIDDQILNRVKKLGIQSNSTQVEKVQKVTDFIVQTLSYEYPPKVREAIDVLSTSTSDCGGYHALFAALLRSVGIPVAIDFGFRLPKMTPHVWAWWYDVSVKQWNMIDLNDIQTKSSIGNRVSFSLNTGHEIKYFPKPVQFIQEKLSWDWNFDLHKKIFGRVTTSEIEFHLSTGV